MAVGDKFYRIVDSDIAHNKPILQTMFVVRETSKSAWVVHSWAWPLQAGYVLNRDNLRRIGARLCGRGTRRAYAYPTLALAVDSYRIRKQRQIQHAENTLEHAKENLEWINNAQVEHEYLAFKEPEPINPYNFPPFVKVGNELF